MRFTLETALAREALFNGISRSLFTVFQRSLKVAEYIPHANSVCRCRSRDRVSVKPHNDCGRAITLKHYYLLRARAPFFLRIDDHCIRWHFNFAA